MAIATATVWEVRTTGSDTNGGAYSTGGTDYSQQDAAQLSLTDAVANGTTTVTSATAGFTSAMVGNVCYMVGGTGPLTAVRRQIVTFTNSTTVVLDATVATGTGITMNVGGAVANPGAASSAHVSGNTIYVKNGTYTVNNASAATSTTPQGCVSLVAGLTTADTRLIGYASARGDNPTGATRPLLQASGISTFTLVTLAAHSAADYVQVDGAGLTSSRGFSVSAATAYRCKALNCTNSGIFGSSSFAYYVLCEATGCSSASAISIGSGLGCIAWANTGAGFGGGFFTDCISFGNTTANGYGFFNQSSATYQNCTSYGNAAAGFRFQSNTGVQSVAANCVSVGNAGNGFEASASLDLVRLFNCATQGNLAATSNIPVACMYGTVVLTGNPFTNAAGNDFSLNTTSGAGLACRAAGIPGAFPPGASTTSYKDLGAAAHHDVGSVTSGGCRGVGI